MINLTPEDFSGLISSLIGLRCWYVSCGGAGGSTFQLGFGERAKRFAPLKNSAHSEEFRQSEPEVSLFVWCTWRLDDADGCLSSSDDMLGSIEVELSKLVGADIESLEAMAPMWDMNINFSSSRSLYVFCDHVPGDPSFDGNWELRTQNCILAVGPGTNRQMQERGS